MEMIKIDRDVPPPPKPVGRRPIYPWRTLKVGESFLMKTTNPDDARGQAYRNQKITGFIFTTKLTNKGLRVWRIK